MAKGSVFAFTLNIILFANLVSYSTELKTNLSQSQFTIGDKINFTVSGKIPKGSKIIPPTPDKTFGNLTVKEWDLKTTELPDADSVSIQYIITTYIPEHCTIPELPFILQTENSSDTLFTEQVPLQLQSVLNASDSIIDIKDLRQQQNTGNTPKWWLWALLVLAGISLLIFGLILLRKRKHKSIVTPPPKPPYEEAIEALGKLHGKRYLQQGLIREYVFELSEIFKRYIGRRFEVNAEEFTAEELIAWLGVSGLSLQIRHPVEWFFKTTDLVKFAKYTPANDTIERFGAEVMNFLEVTKPQPVQKADEKINSNPTESGSLKLSSPADNANPTENTGVNR